MTNTTPFFATAARGFALSSVFALTLMSPLAAQDAATEAPAEAAADEPEIVTADTAQPGQTYTLEKHGDWEIRCVNVAEGQKDPCTIYQLLLDENGNQIAEFTMFELPDGSNARAGGTIIAPLNTLLQPGIALAIDGRQGKRYPFAFCNQIGCYARIGFTADEVSGFKAGASAKMQVAPVGGEEGSVVNLTVSLTGFTAAYNRTAEINSQ